MQIPTELDPLKLKVTRALGPIKPATHNTKAEDNFLLKAFKSNASELLPKHYLIYLTLVELLKFRDLGHSEKIAWSIPIDYKGKAFLIEYRKFGVGIFVQDIKKDEEAAKEIAILLQKAVKSASKFFDWLADQAVASSDINVNNGSRLLYDRYIHFRDAYKNKSEV